ncbi:hypothetical protein BGZ83_004020, partial [Gryganskiella cystojenkinii]
MANLTKYTDGQKTRLEKKREVIEGMEAKLQEQRKALGELRLAAKKANELDQELGHASKRVRVLAEEARDLGLAAEQATRIYDPSATTNLVTPDPAEPANILST